MLTWTINVQVGAWATLLFYPEPIWRVLSILDVFLCSNNWPNGNCNLTFSFGFARNCLNDIVLALTPKRTRNYRSARATRYVLICKPTLEESTLSSCARVKVRTNAALWRGTAMTATPSPRDPISTRWVQRFIWCRHLTKARCSVTKFHFSRWVLTKKYSGEGNLCAVTSAFLNKVTQEIHRTDLLERP